MMRFDTITIFPEMFSALTEFGVTSRALKMQKAQLSLWNPRDYTTDTRRTVDDRAYGGGPGMVMMVPPLEGALDAIKQDVAVHHLIAGPTILLSPQGRLLNQALVDELGGHSQITLVCGRYEAVDQRFIERRVDFELSLGDFVVSGGEIPAMMLMDSLIRQIPGVLGDEQSAEQDSFKNGLLDCPHYTRPENYENFFVPDVLLGGHHAKITDWRRQQALMATQTRRPDLIEKARRNQWLSPSDEEFLREFEENSVKNKLS
jgi:tRNA (guanine37-N1)-methyltransferase